jgi:polar amino acid transport system substrate-binding protein
MLGKPFVLAAVLAISAYSSCAIADDSVKNTQLNNIPGTIQNSGKLILGTDATVGLPWTSTKEGTMDKFVGFDPELAAAIAAKLGLKLEVSTMGWDSLLPSLQADRVNFVMSGMSDTAEREKKIDFIVYAIGGSATLVKAQGTDNIKSHDDLCGLSVSSMRGSTDTATAVELSNKCVAAGKAAVNVQTFPGNDSQLAALSSGRSDAAFGDFNYFGLTALRLPEQFRLAGEPFNMGPVGIAVPKGSSLGPVILKTLNELIADGTYDKISKQYQLPEMARVSKAVLNGASLSK